jgi:hypothetical protein
MAPLGRLPVFAVAQLALMGGLAWTWLATPARGPACSRRSSAAAPAVLALRLGATSQDDRQQYVARLLACAAMLPILLMMWAGAQDTPAPTRRWHPGCAIRGSSSPPSPCCTRRSSSPPSPGSPAR